MCFTVLAVSSDKVIEYFHIHCYHHLTKNLSVHYVTAVSNSDAIPCPPVLGITDGQCIIVWPHLMVMECK